MFTRSNSGRTILSNETFQVFLGKGYTIASWWFQTFFSIFASTWGRFPILTHIFQMGCSTTNEVDFYSIESRVYMCWGLNSHSHVAPTSPGCGWVGLDGAKRIGAMVLTFTDWDAILEISKYYSTTEMVCPCHPIVTAHMQLVKVISMSNTCVTCECKVISNPHLRKDEFCGRKIWKDTCAHDLASNCFGNGCALRHQIF